MRALHSEHQIETLWGGNILSVEKWHLTKLYFIRIISYLFKFIRSTLYALLSSAVNLELNFVHRGTEHVTKLVCSILFNSILAWKAFGA